MTRTELEQMSIPQLQELLADLQAQESVDIDRVNLVRNVLSEKEAAAELEQEKAEREQQQAQHIDGLMAAVQSLGLFEAIVPQPADGERLYEYDERRKEFYLILHDFVKEQQKALIDQHNRELEAKDEKIKVLTRQGIEAENQAADLRNQLDKLVQEYRLRYDAAITERDKAIQERDEAIQAKERSDEEVQRLTGVNAQLRQEIAELKSKLEQAQKPAEYTPPSQSLAERVQSLKIKSWKETSADEWVKRFEERMKNGPTVMKIEPPTTPEIGGGSFRGEAETVAQSGAADGQEVSFQASQENAHTGGIPTLVKVDDGNVGEVAGETFEQEVRRRLSALERQVFGREMGAA